MTDNPSHRVTEKRSGLLISGAIIVVVALILAAVGIASRIHAEASLRHTAEDTASPLVTVVHPETTGASEAVMLPGTVKAFAKTPIYARTSGYLRRWTVDIGAHVRAGQLLADIDTPEIAERLRQAQADLHSAQANAAVARSTATRAEGLVATQSVSRQEGEDRAAAATATASQVLGAQANVSRLRKLVGFQRVEAPYSGVITARETDVGNLINAGSGVGQELFKITDLSRLRIFVQVPQSYAAAVKVGTPGGLHFPDHPNRPYPATVVRTASALDPASRTLLVELDLANASGELLPGGYAEVGFKLSAPGRGLRLSGNTLLFRAEGPAVAVVGNGGRWSPCCWQEH